MRNISEKKRIVIKLGTSTLAHKTGKLNIRRMTNLVRVISDLHNSGREIIMVSSGAVGLGAGKLGLSEKPKETKIKQAVAAIGQCELMHVYDDMFAKYSVTVAQILLTKTIINDSNHCRNFMNTVDTLVSMGVIPIVNENDTIAIDELELEIGENDSLSALVADLSGADLLLILSDIDCLYITSPDYLGNLADIKAIADISHRAGVPLAVDNAHGSYMAFLDDNTHPIALGADMCCDSAHKTLPCYTGGAYLHFSNKSPDSFLNNAKSIMSMFGSTSPSYLILQSLDLCGEMLASGEFAKKLAHSTAMVRSCKEKIEGYGWVLCGQEKMKITVCAAKCGYNGCELGDKLRETGIEPEYCDGEYVVFMAGISNTQNDFDKLAAAFKTLPVKPPIDEQIPGLLPAESRLSMRRAAFSHSQSVDIHSAVGRICALTVTGCQPSVPVTVSGEVVSENAVKLLEACGVEKINVL